MCLCLWILLLSHGFLFFLTLQLEERAEMVDLIFKHVEECEALEKRRCAAKQSENRLNLFGGGGGSR